MAKICDTCDGPLDGLFKKTCTSCSKNRLDQFNGDQRAQIMRAFEAKVADARAANPSLVEAFEELWKIEGHSIAAAYEPGTPAPRAIPENLTSLIPAGENVLAVVSGIQDGTAFWVLTDKNIVMSRYTVFKETPKSSEIAAISMITGIESKVVNAADGSKRIIVSRASNTDELFGVSNATAAQFISLLNEARSNSTLGGQVTIQPANNDPATAIRKLKELLDDGLISGEEFEVKRKEILAKI